MTVFEWDSSKSSSNERNHGISFQLATLVFRDPFVLLRFDTRFGDKHRWQAIGRVDNRIIFVAHTYRENEHEEEVVRIISARKAHSSERLRYQNDR